MSSVCVSTNLQRALTDEKLYAGIAVAGGLDTLSDLLLAGRGGVAGDGGMLLDPELVVTGRVQGGCDIVFESQLADKCCVLDFLRVCRLEIDGVGVEANERNRVFAKVLSTLAPYRHTNVRKSTTIELCRRLSAIGPLLI